MSGTNLTINEATEPLSSVQIEGRAKGPPSITVKVYATDVAEAAKLARDQYDALVALYQAGASEREDADV